ncbi:hypothetical protein M885DRAFT_533081 [Pelagophyceae sp. CCMP2097]|nr:hypothetical protein M885DRAFT_533081 [Pelagophyceae sp. CCMP2097]
MVPPWLLLASVASASRGRCVLSPTHAPHFDFYARLLQSIKRHASDPNAVDVYYVVDGQSNVNAFEDRHPEWKCNSAKCFATPLTMEKLLVEFGSSHTIMNLELKRASAERRFWEDGRRHQALKKLYGVRWLRAKCDQVWVLDSESFALRNFSWQQSFQDWFGRNETRNLFSDQRDELCGNVDKRSHQLNAGPLDALGITTDARQEFKQLHFRTMDYWFFQTDVVEAMMGLVEFLNARKFLNVFVEHAAGAAIYYGVFAHAYLSPGSSATRQANVSALKFLSKFSLPSFLPQSYCNLVSKAYLPSTSQKALQDFKSQGCKLHVDLDLALINGGGESAKCALNVELRRDVLKTAFPWLHGYRFDRSKGRSDVAELFLSTPHITWATSNWHGQFLLAR